MKEILKLIDNVNKTLRDKKILPSPSNYEREFFNQLKKTDILLEDYIELQELKEFLNEDEKDIFKKSTISTFKDFAKLLSNRVPESEIKLFLKHLSFYMSPSLFDEEIRTKIYETCTQIAKFPKELTSAENLRKLRKITDDRIAADKEHFSNKTSDVKELISFLDKHFTKVLNGQLSTLTTINEIKQDISNINLSKNSKEEISFLQEKLFNSISQMETILKKSNCDLKDNQEECLSLHQQIQVLQDNLNKAEEEKSIDYLTGLLTRRAYDLEIEKIENEYNTFNSKYAVVFFDIDYFKKINDSYGHDCGDVVLSTFAKILKNLTRVEDIITRYGGEEFIAIIHYKNSVEIEKYLHRAKNIITNNKFIYKDIKLNVQFSAGVTFRKNYVSYDETVLMADKLLYEAKNAGRNKIVLDTGTIL